MKCLAGIILFTLFFTSVFGQSRNENQREHQDIFIVRVRSTNGSLTRGALQAVNDSSMVVMNKRSKIITIAAQAIRHIKVRKKGNVKRVMGIGAGVGAALGGIIGFVSYDDSQEVEHLDRIGKGFSAFAGVMVGAVVGAGVGAIVGSHSKKIKVEGNAEKFTEIMPVLSNYLLPSQKHLTFCRLRQFPNHSLFCKC
jgi:hypothetical protein